MSTHRSPRHFLATGFSSTNFFNISLRPVPSVTDRSTCHVFTTCFCSVSFQYVSAASSWSIFPWHVQARCLFHHLRHMTGILEYVFATYSYGRFSSTCPVGQTDPLDMSLQHRSTTCSCNVSPQHDRAICRLKVSIHYVPSLRPIWLVWYRASRL